MNDDFIILIASVLDLFTYEKIDREQVDKHLFGEKLNVCGKYLRMRPKLIL